MGIIKKIVGSRNDRLVKSMRKTVDVINGLEDKYASMSDAQLREQTTALRERVQGGETLDSVLPEAFAIVREGGKRVHGMRHFDVQLIGGMVLHNGQISEMRTGEGKTLVATLAAYLNALSGKGVHVITVNDYLAQRDADWMGRIYRFLGLTTGVIVSGLEHDQRQAAYAADITYGTNNEFGFDYLRDNMAFSPEDRVQRELNFAIVDEVDSILIDEARTPLIISGAADDDIEMYKVVHKLVTPLVPVVEKDGPGDFSIDEKAKSVNLTDAGHLKIEQIFADAGVIKDGGSLYDTGNIGMLHYVNAALRAQNLFKKDVDYMVIKGEIVIVDEFTGRAMQGRRWSDGLHQAIEAKENVKVNLESQTLASITFQNYFRLYNKLSGMTGTADTEALEFAEIYGLEVVIVPTHRDVTRVDHGDRIYLTGEEKFEALIEDVQEAIAKGQPVLVGTASIHVSEYISQLLTKSGIKHSVLNAKQHEREAHIIAEAGRPGNVTIATNMAGRGTDIVLGGSLDEEMLELGEDATDQQKAALKEDWQQRHETALAAGGLHVIGTERHESRRIDNQLRGRSGRQGDPGSTRFYLSLEDSLMRIFATGRMGQMMQRLGMEKGEAIEHPWVTKAIENAQRKVESHNFDVRKQLLEYDDVANDQRRVVYQQRNELMSDTDISDIIVDLREDVVAAVFSGYIAPGSMPETWDVAGLEQALKDEFHVEYPLQEWLDADSKLYEETLLKRVVENMVNEYREKEFNAGAELMRTVEKHVMLQTLDRNWKEHLAEMDQLRRSVSLMGYAQKNPKQEYKRLGFERFADMLERVKLETISYLTKMRQQTEEDVQESEEQMRRQAEAELEYQHPDVQGEDEEGIDVTEEQARAQAREQRRQAQPTGGQGGTQVRGVPKVGRNEPCPCGSGKKYKQCHGKV